jgi:hypothetical protein
MNAKQEFLEEIRGRDLICAKIGIDTTDFGNKIRWFILKDNYAKEDWERFCDELDFEYDDGYGAQELFGVILFKDSYSDRYEYDGSEWWANHKMLTIKEVLGLNH